MKRTASTTNVSPNKMPKVDPAESKVVEALICSEAQEDRLPSGSTLHEINLLNLKDCKVFLKTNGVFIKNLGAKQVRVGVLFLFLEF